MMSNILATIRFTIAQKAKSKTLITMTVIFSLILSAMIHIPYVLSLLDEENEATTYSIGIISEENSDVTPSLQQYGQQADAVDMVLLSPDNEDMSWMRSTLEEKELDAILQVKQQSSSENVFPTFTYYYNDESEALQEQIRSMLEIIKAEVIGIQLGLTEDQLIEVRSPIVLEQVSLEEADQVSREDENENKGLQIVLLYVLVITIFMSVTFSGTSIASEITAEKSSRVMEILITSTSPVQQMFGKIIGIFMISLFQLLIIAAVGGLNVVLPHNAEVIEGLNIAWSAIDPFLVIYAFVYYILGFFLYATLFGALGSMVSRVEEINQVTLPVMLLVIVGFYISIWGLNIPESSFVVFSSYFPFFTPFVMFLRIIMSDISFWEILLSWVILLASAIGIGVLAAKVYKTGVLMYGKRPSMNELRKAMKTNK
ncbi:ABC transporter permease [Longirhabdus pacifica]|uniref:ABC transporter permease n=1 Tax=Longirhabdus pacifica TaxID=2305227 RepID=UPI001008F177|nr:ABC transporter permease [Longirhabdus pacifica]